MQVLQIVAIVILAILPILAWSYIFLNKTDESKRLMLKVFVWGGLSTLPLLLYRWLWTFFPDLNFIKTITDVTAGNYITLGSLVTVPIGLVMIFMTIGFLEELLKSLVVRKIVPRKEIDYIADAVEFSIVAALGFAFVENIFYLAEVYYVIGSSALIKMFISRALFATFAHTLFSGIFGYYYGISVFAAKNVDNWKSSLDLKMIKGLEKPLPWLSRIRVFRMEEILIGLCYAGALHAFYNIFLELKFTMFLIPFLVFGFIVLNRLLNLERKRVKRD